MYKRLLEYDIMIRPTECQKLQKFAWKPLRNPTSSTNFIKGGRVVTVVSMSSTNWKALAKTGFESRGSVCGVPDHA